MQNIQQLQIVCIVIRPSERRPY